jgi:DNA-directed RNA polymerase subunit RPC12/RpoP
MQNSPEIEKENINRYLCKGCGGAMVYNPQTGLLTCNYCGATEIIKVTGSVDENDYESFLTVASSSLQPMATNAMQVGCDSCGAIVNFTPPETAKDCDFCGAKIVAQPKAADPLVAPEGVLPFSIAQPVAVSALKDWINSRWFAPSKLKEFARPDKIHSIYIPYWTYDSQTSSNYTGERGDHYSETEYYQENGEERSRQVQKTRWYSVSGSTSRSFDDVAIPATKSLSEKYLQKLEPWDLQDLKPFEPAYLAGHKAQTYQVSLPEGFERFKSIAASQIENDCENDIGGNEQRVHNVDTYYADIRFKHLLLPVYAGAYSFNGKVFQIVVNGRTGLVQGERPYSWFKIAALVFAIIGAILFIVILVGLFKK